MHECEMNELFIEQFADNELSYEESSEIANHIKECEYCRKKYEEIIYLKTILKQEAQTNKLSEIEKIGLEQLIDNTGKNKFFEILSNFFERMGNHFFISAFSGSAIATMVFIVFFLIKQNDDFNQRILHEIVAIHSRKMPKEFDSKNDIEAIINKNLKTNIHIKQFIKKVGYVKGRFANLDTIPLVSLKIHSSKGNSTLLLAKDNKIFAKIFKNAGCLTGFNCKIKQQQKEGKQMFFWKNHKNNYIVVNDNKDKNLNPEMLALVNYNE